MAQNTDHRSNRVGIGVLPLPFKDADSVETIGSQGVEEFGIVGLEDV